MTKILNRTSIEEILPAQRITATGNQSSVDMQDYRGIVVFTLLSSAGGGTSPTLDIILQDSPDNSTWTANTTFTRVTDAADSHEVLKVNIDESDRYFRARAVVSGTTPTFDCGVTATGLKQYQ